jgi:hypothetical protein
MKRDASHNQAEASKAAEQIRGSVYPFLDRCSSSWTYSGLGIENRDSAQYRYVRGQVQRTKNRVTDLDPRLFLGNPVMPVF